jgi:hypothetical protein
MANSPSSHILGPASLHEFTSEEGHLADETLGIPLSRRQHNNTFHFPRPG